MRISRVDSTKKEVPTRGHSKAATPKDKAQVANIAAENGGNEVKKESLQVETIPVEDKEKSKPSLIAPPPVQEQSITAITTSSTSTAQPRRSMTRARKPSSRLLPSPSPPPPTRSSNYHNYPAKATQTAASTMHTGGISNPKITQKKQQSANLITVRATAGAIESNSTVTNGTIETTTEKEDFGPGKRKRRPSTMSKPPSTITKSIAPVIISQADGMPGTASTASTLKVRISRIPSKSQSPEEKGSQNVEKSSRKVKADNVIVHTADPVSSLQLPQSASEVNASGGYESDSNAEGALLMALADAEGDAEHDGDSDAGVGSNTKVKKLMNGVRIKGQHSLSAAREKFGARRWPTSSGYTLEPPPLISRRGGLKLHQGLSHASQRSPKQTSSENNHSRSQSTSVLDGRWAWTPSGIAPTLRFRLSDTSREDESSEASDLEEEDDFHVAMLKGDDFGDSHRHKAASLCSKSSHRGSKSGDDSENEDTPATTPRSPQSTTCDLPERRWSSSVEDEDKDSGKSCKDAVFAHALEPSSRRPHTHAGSLTLSLPFDEMIQANDEEQQLKLRSRVKEEDHDSAQSRSDVRTIIKEEDDEIVTAGLLSPAVHPSILGLSSKQHNLMFSSPHASSAFASPTFEASNHGIKSEPAPLSLPPPASLPKSKLIHALDEVNQMKREGERAAPSASGLHSSEVDEDEKGEEHAALVMELPERMCLSELDRAWEQSEHLSKKKSQMAGSIDEDGGSEKDVEEAVMETNAQQEEYEESERPKRGVKRADIASQHEEPAGKKSKPSPKHKSPARPTGRRSARHSGAIKA